MAKYHYECNRKDCHYSEDIELSIKEDAPKNIGPCEAMAPPEYDERCKGTLVRVITGGSGFQFKGGSPTK